MGQEQFLHSCTNPCTNRARSDDSATIVSLDSADKDSFERESCRSASRVAHRRLAGRELSVAGRAFLLSVDSIVGTTVVSHEI
jgi:hypothetical protein